MILKLSFLCKTLFLTMNSNVFHKASFLFVSVSTLRASERLFLTMNPHVFHKASFLSVSVSTLRASERLFDICFLNAATH